MMSLRTLALVTVIASTAGFLGAVAFSVHFGLSWTHLTLFVVMYLFTSFGVEGGMHRYFTHRSFATGSVLATLLGVAGCMAAQGPILFWVSVHRKHHAFADREGDPHSPQPIGDDRLAVVRGLWHGHMGWLFRLDRTGWHRFVPDLLQENRILWLDRYYAAWVLLGLALPAAVAYGLTGNAVDMLGGLLWGGLARMFLLHHVTWSVNSLGHTSGRRPHETRDASHNIASLAPITIGGSWHNNHHARPALAHNRQQFWQVDLTGSVIRLLDLAGLVTDVRYPDRPHREEARR
ncbi:acyl-CoA desaturase [Lentzea sp. NPDC004782]|uniref:acyl-CoA desaturase n=1 Tax=Lentzea sp. NPDC004782 TaxID=3154458 RepID=UPI00339EC140